MVPSSCTSNDVQGNPVKGDPVGEGQRFGGPESGAGDNHSSVIDQRARGGGDVGDRRLLGRERSRCVGDGAGDHETRCCDQDRYRGTQDRAAEGRASVMCLPVCDGAHLNSTV